MTSPLDVVASYQEKFIQSCAGENFGKVAKGILEISYGSGVMQQKVGFGGKFTPPLVLCVLRHTYLKKNYISHQFAPKVAWYKAKPETLMCILFCYASYWLILMCL